LEKLLFLKQRKDDSYNPLAVCLLLSFLVFMVYFPSLFHPFVHDDIFFIVQNPHIREFNWRAIITQPSWPAQGDSLVNAYYRPLLEILYRLQYKLFQLNPVGYHLTNVLFHGLNGFLVFTIIRSVLAGLRFSSSVVRNEHLALATALLFLVHPVQAEAVNCIVGISNILCAFFMLVAFYGYLFFQNRPKGRGVFYGGSLIAFVLALLTKEQAIVFPLLLIIYDGTQRRFAMVPKIRAMAGWSGFFGLAVGYLFLRRLLLGASVFTYLRYSPELALRILAIPRTLLTYIRIIFVPWDLHYYRSLDILQPFVPGMIIGVIVLAGGAWLLRQMEPPVRRVSSFGLFWFGVILLPVLNIVPLINEYSLILTADHFLYLPVVGLIVFSLMVWVHWAERKNLAFHGSWMRELFWLIILLLTLMTVQQNQHFRSEIALFENTVKHEKRFGRGHILLGKAYYANDQVRPAIMQYQQALSIMYGYYAKVGRSEARSFYARLIEEIYFDLAHCYERLHQEQKALWAYAQALSLNSQNAVVYNNMGVLFMRWGRISQAVRCFEASYEIDQNILAKRNLVHAQRRLDRPAVP
jgi:hypothetical protein